MATTTPDIFIDDFESQAKHAYQRMGSLLLGTHRLSSNIKGDRVFFPKFGTATAYSKARGGQIPSSNTETTRVSATLEEKWYRDDIDDYDQFKTNVELRGNYAKAGAMALGRAQDQLVIDAMVAGVTQVVEEDDIAADSGLTKDVLLYLKELAGKNDVTGQLWWAVDPSQVTDLMNINEFASADYNVTKPFAMPPEGMFRFLGINFIVHTGLPLIESGETRATFMWAEDAVGSASPNAMAMNTNVEKLVKEQAWQISSSWSMASTVIDDRGLWQVNCHEA